MKRLNPETGLPFKKGQIRLDGYVFRCYRLTKIIKQTGYFKEDWANPISFKIDLKQCLERKQNRRITHPEKFKISQKDWVKRNRGIKNAHTAKYRAVKLQRTPVWLSTKQLNDIKNWYVRANLIKNFTGENWHVDHQVPLQGSNVSGLHVPWNLQLLSRQENSSKRNKHIT